MAPLKVIAPGPPIEAFEPRVTVPRYVAAVDELLLIKAPAVDKAPKPVPLMVSALVLVKVWPFKSSDA